MRAMKALPIVFLCCLLASVTAQAEQGGIIVRKATVYAEATSASAIVARVDAGLRVSVFSRKGGWNEIYSEDEGIIGWVRVYQVRQGDIADTSVTTEKEDSRGFLAGLATFSRKASGFFRQDSGATSSGTATIGVRGLSEVEIESAQADFIELETLQGFASQSKRMSGFSTAGQLKAVKVPHLPEPE